MSFKILLVQNNAIIGNKDATFNKVLSILEPYKGKSYDIIVFPEVWSVGWYCQNFKKEAEELKTSETVAFLKRIAKEFKSNIIGGSFILKKEDTYTNCCPVVDKNGELITTYEKMHLFSHKGSEENKYVSTGNELKIINIGKAKIAITICYDIRFPEIYREYSKAGANILINLAAWSNTKLEHWNIMHQARAIENQCYMLACDQTGKIVENEYNLGHSMVIDPWGNIVSNLKEEESCLEYEIEIDYIYKLRENFPLLKDRRDFTNKLFNIKEIYINE